MAVRRDRPVDRRESLVHEGVVEAPADVPVLRRWGREGSAMSRDRSARRVDAAGVRLAEFE
jgi:hypothetical protein